MLVNHRLGIVNSSIDYLLVISDHNNTVQRNDCIK